MGVEIPGGRGRGRTTPIATLNHQNESALKWAAMTAILMFG